MTQWKKWGYTSTCGDAVSVNKAEDLYAKCCKK